MFMTHLITVPMAPFLVVVITRDVRHRLRSSMSIPKRLAAPNKDFSE